MNIKNILNIIRSCDGKNIFKKKINNNILNIEYIIICSGISKIHVKFIYKEIVKIYKKKILNYEKDILYEWVVLDLYNTVIHIMQEKSRINYNLEELFNKI